MKFERRYISTEVICVKFYEDYILAGVGGCLKIFEVDSGNVLLEEEIFIDHLIHGITHDHDGRFVLHGAKDVVIIKISRNTKERISIDISTRLNLCDWVMATHWLSSGSILSVVTAHNVMILWNWKKSFDTSQLITCAEKCILYSALIGGQDQKDCVIFSGTVFQEIVIWLPKSHRCDQPVLHRLRGHQGVIFSISWDWRSSTLCSTSDDRSVRLWHVDFEGENDWAKTTVRAGPVCYGHTARVWRSLVIGNVVTSIGEDGQICAWGTDGKLLKCWKTPTTSCIWTIDYSEKYKTLVTGLSDGSILLWPFSLPIEVPQASSISFSEKLIASISSARKLVLLKCGDAIIVMNDGSIFQKIFDQQNLLWRTEWRLIHKDYRYSSYCVLAISPCRTRFALASLTGDVAVFESAKGILNKKLEEGKIWNIVFLKEDELLVCGEEGRLTLWSILKTPDGEVNAECKDSFLLPKSRERWPTTATTFSKNDRTYLVCGDRCGSLHLYTFSDNLKSKFSDPTHTLSRIHGKQGVTAVISDGNQIISTGRDGTVRRHDIDTVTSRLCPLSADKMIMDWVCGVLPALPHSTGRLVIGFKETHFMLYNIEEKSVVLNLYCGGGHRSWDFMILNGTLLHMIFVREKNFWGGSWLIKDLFKPPLLRGLHSRYINCLRIIEFRPTILATAGEDGLILLSQFFPEKSTEDRVIYKLGGTTSLTSHISSVKCLAVDSNLLFSGGGRAQLKVWRIDADIDGKIKYVELASHMLKEESLSLTPSLDVEMHYMSLCCIHKNSDDEKLLVAGCSDGIIRLLTFSAIESTLQIINESKFHGCCVLNVSSVRLKDDRSIVISAATDGVVAFWDLSLDEDNSTYLKLLHSIRSNQSGINAIFSVVESKESWSEITLTTGGDDNSIYLVQLKVYDDKFSLISEWRNSTAHSAQITGVWLCGKYLFSASIDQRVTVWDLKSSTSGLEGSFQNQYISSVADVQDMQIWRDCGSLLLGIAGKGIEILEVN